MIPRRRQPSHNVARALDGVRKRRATGADTSGDAVGDGLTIDASNRHAVALGDAMGLDARKRITPIIDEETLQISSGSPKRIMARVKPSEVRAVEADVATNTDNISELDDRTTNLLTNHEGRLQAIEADRVPQTFLADGDLDVTLGKVFLVLIDNTAADVTVDIDPVARGEINVKVIAYDGGFTCRLRAKSGNIDGVGTYDFTAALESVRILCDGTDWWVI